MYKYSVAYITNNIAPFRVDLLDTMAQYTTKVTLYYFQEIDAGVNPDYVKKRPTIAQCKCLKDLSLNQQLKIVCKDDVIIFDGYSGKDKLLIILALIIRRHKYFVSIDGIIPRDEDKKGIKTLLKGFLLEHACGVFSTNGRTDALLRNIARKIKLRRHIFTTLHEQDFSLFASVERDRIFKQYELDANKKLVLFVGKFLKTKGIYELLDSVDDGYQYLFVGGEFSYLDIGDRDKIPANVRCVKFLEKEHILSLMKAADLFVLPTYTDVWGLVIVEALSAGIPIVTTDNCNAGLEFITPDKNGYIIPIRDSKALKEAIEKGLALRRSDVEKYNEGLIDGYTVENGAKDILLAIEEEDKDEKY